MAKQGIYRTGKVAEMLGLSRHQVRRLCETGMIQATLAPGRHWGIPAEEVARLQREGTPPVPSAANDVAPADDEIVVHSGIPLKSTSHQLMLPAPAQTLALPDRAHPVARSQGECRELHKPPVLQAARFDESTRQPHTALAPIQKRQASQIVHAREEWHDRWLENALFMVPWETPKEHRLEVKEEVDKTLQSLQPQTSDLVTRQLVEAAVQRGLRSWRAAQDTEKALSRALGVLPGPSMSYSELNSWQIRAREEAISAISRLSSDAPFEAKLVAASTAVQKVTRQFAEQKLRIEEQNLRKKVIDESISLLLLTGPEKEDAKAAIRAGIEALPTGVSEAELRRARQIALRRFEEMQRQRETQRGLERMVELNLSHIQAFLDRLWSDGELEGFENYSEVWRYADEIREEVRSDLLEELSGKPQISDYRVKSMIEDLVDDLLSQ